VPANLNPYLNFRGSAREALTFYHSVFGGELNTSSFAEFGMSQGEDDKDLVMHGQLTTSNGWTLMASDVPDSMPYTEGTNTFSVSLSGGPEDDEELHGYWDKLGDGGQVAMPLEKAPWGDQFGQLTDKFGVQWMVNIGGGQEPPA
jgi:PhnB protein